MLKKSLTEFTQVALPKATAGVLMLLLNLALARTLAPGEFATFSLCLATVLLLDSVIGGAVDLAVLRLAPVKQATDPEGARAVELSALLLKLALALVSLPFVLLAAPWLATHLLHRPGGSHLIWLTALTTIALLSMRSTLVHLQVLGDFRGYGAVDWVNIAARFGIAGLLLLAGLQQADVFVAAILMGPVCATLFNLRRVWAPWQAGWLRWRAEAPALARSALWFLPTLAIGAVLGRMDLYLVSGLGGVTQAGLFAAAAAVAAIPELLGTYMTVVMAPRVMPAVQSRRMMPVLLKVQGALVLLAVVGLLLALWLLPWLLQVFLPQFEGLAPVALLLLVGGAASLVSLPFLMPFLLFQRPHFMLTLDAVVLPPTLAGYVWAIGTHGALGAAAVTAISKLVRMTVSHLYALHLVRREVDLPGDPQGQGPNSPNPGPPPSRGLARRLLRPYGLWNQVWNIDCALRYRTARELLRDTAPERIVEVGAGVAGLGFLLKRPVLGVDLSFNAAALRQSNPYVIPVVGTGVGLPLADDTMDAALSIDSIEHVPGELREAAIRELLRVARRRVVISIPCGSAAIDADARLIAWHRARHGARDFWLSEHLERGLPTEADMRQAVERAAQGLSKQARLTTIEDMPLLVHDVNHRVLMVANYRFARLLSWVLWLLYPLLRRLASPARYRRFFVIDLAPRAPAHA